MIRGPRYFFTRHKGLWVVTACLVGLLAWSISMECSIRSFFKFSHSSLEPVSWALYRPHPTLFWTLRPYFNGPVYHATSAYDDPLPSEKRSFNVSTNAWGIRGGQIKQKKGDNQWRMLCLGDEMTFGYGVQDHQTYEMQLQKHMRNARRDQHLQVINAGCPGWSSYQAREWTRLYGRYFKPDFYILGFGYADTCPEDMTDLDRINPLPPVRWLQLALYRSELYMYNHRLNYRQVNPYGLPPVDYKRQKLRVSKEQYRENLQWFVDLAKAEGSRVIFLNLPRRDLETNELCTEFRFVTQEVAQTTQSLYVDLQKVMISRAKEELFSEDTYPNAKGYDLIALTIMVEMQRLGWQKP